MNRLWVRLSLAISTIFIVLIIVPTVAILVMGLILGPADFDRDHRDFSRPDHPNFSWPDPSENADFRQNSRNLVRIIPPLVLQFVLCVGLIGIAAGVLVSRGLTKPISELADATKMIGSGDLSHRVKVKGSKEMTDLAQSFNQMAVDLEQAETLRRNLMADVSHELRTPLTVLEGNLRAALDHVYELDDEELANLYHQTNHLIRLVNDLRELALAEAHQLPLDVQETEINMLIEEIIAVFSPLADEKGVKLNQQLPSKPILLQVDGRRLRQVLHNLLSNALRHTTTDEQIMVMVQPETTSLTITIADTGEGIEPEAVPLVFDRFYRTDRSRSRDTGGTGLGLAIAKAIIEAHNGTLTAESDGLHQGSRFIISLPNQSAAQTPLRYDGNSERYSTKIAKLTIVTPLAKEKMLLCLCLSMKLLKLQAAKF